MQHDIQKGAVHAQYRLTTLPFTRSMNHDVSAPLAVSSLAFMSKMDGIAATRLIKTQYPQIAVVGLTRDLKDYTLYSMKKAGAFEVVDKKSAVVQLYDAIQRALGIDGKGVDLPEMGPGLGSMTEAT